jgi:folate-binding protein YgfZ
MHINISTSSAIFRWKPAAWLRVTGEDAAGFLQGQFTNDLRPLGQPGTAAVYGLWLTVKGKVLADSFVLSRPGAAEFWVGSYFSAAALIRERLESHIIADDVAIEDRTADWEGVTCSGETETRVGGQAERDGGFVFPGRRGGGATTECVFERGKLPPGLASWSGRELGSDEMARRRIAAGIPAIPADLGSADLPNEAGLEADAISYTKGCYLGQEVMARLKSMGQVRRRLVRVRGSGGVPGALPAPLFAGARQAGDLRTAVSDGSGGWVGLAMVSKLSVGATTALAFSPDGPAGVDLMEIP